MSGRGSRRGSSNHNKQFQKVTFTKPTKSSTIDDWGKQLVEQLKIMNQNIENVGTSVDFACDQASDAVEKIEGVSKEMKNLTEQFEELSRENDKLRSENQTLSERLLKLECHQRRNNIIFEGIAEQEEGDDNCLQKVRDLIKDLPNVPNNMKISRCHRVGPYRPGQTRGVICHIHWYGDKLLLYKNKRRLPMGVKIHDDYPPEIEERRRALKPILKAALGIDHYKGNTFLSVDKLIVNKTTYTYAPIYNLDQLPEDINPASVCEKRDEDTLVYFGIGSPLSNFHKSEFKIDNTLYTCNEQYIQSQKASLFNDDIAEQRIMQTTNPYKMKAIGSRIRNFSKTTWENKGKQIAKKGALHKFQQNGHLKQFLLDTDKRQIAEASEEKPWGAGIKLQDSDALDSSKWKGTGWMGEILVQIREILKK